jgi:hypothetical protein
MELSRGNAQADKWYQVSPVLDASKEGALCALGKICDWLVLATPSPIGVVPPRNFPKNDLTYLGYESAGVYGLFVYSSDLFPIRKRIQAQLVQAPIAPDVRAIEEQIRRHASATPNGVLSLGMPSTALLEQLGLITAARRAERISSPDRYFSTILSVDALEWTKHWLGDRRCDLLQVSIARSSDVSPRIVVTALESKARGGNQEIRLSPTEEIFSDATVQLKQTLEALDEILLPETGETFLADLKQGAFVEHLLSEVLARISPIRPDESWKREVLKLLTALSRREISRTDLLLNGMVVLTQTQATLETKRMTTKITAEDM